MKSPLIALLRTGVITQREMFPDLPDEAIGLPTLAKSLCTNDDCRACETSCPTSAITVSGSDVTLDRGLCIGCGACQNTCPSGVIVRDLSTKTAVISRDELILINRTDTKEPAKPPKLPFARSLHIREVSTGDNASDLEILATTNAIFDIARFGIHFVASPRFADALLITGPVGRAMHEPLRRCYDAMAEPRIVIAVGTSAISGGVFGGGYANANGVSEILPVSCFIPGDPPHPWSIIHGILLAMGRI